MRGITETTLLAFVAHAILPKAPTVPSVKNYKPTFHGALVPSDRNLGSSFARLLAAARIREGDDEGTGEQFTAEKQGYFIPQCFCCAPGVDLVQNAAVAARSVKVGNAKVYCLTDGGVKCEAEWMFNQRRNRQGQLENYNQLTEADISENFPGGLAFLSYGCALLETPEVNIILDTSLGCLDPPISSAMTSTRPMLNLTDVLKSVCKTPDDISIVVHTHLHRDHTGWNVVCKDDLLVPFFPNAKHIVQQAEWAYWTSSEALKDRCGFEKNLAPLEKLGMVQLVDGDFEVLPGISLHLCPGHTPGHQVVRISGQRQVAYFIGDALHQIAQVSKPHWSPWFDWTPNTASLNRKWLLQLICDEGALLLSPHFPFPGAGRVQQVENEKKFVPEKLNPLRRITPRLSPQKLSILCEEVELQDDTNEETNASPTNLFAQTFPHFIRIICAAPMSLLAVIGVTFAVLGFHFSGVLTKGVEPLLAITVD